MLPRAISNDARARRVLYLNKPTFMGHVLNVWVKSVTKLHGKGKLFTTSAFLALWSLISTIKTHPVYPELTSQDLIQQLCILDLSIPGQSRVYINIVSAL